MPSHPQCPGAVILQNPRHSVTGSWLWLPVFLILCWLALPNPGWAHGDVHERIEALTQRLASDGPDPAYYFERSGLHRLHGDFDQALRDLEHAATLDPDLPQLDLMRGTLLFETGQPGQALERLNRFLEQEGAHADALVMRARVYEHVGLTDAAIADYDQALAHMPYPTPDFFLERTQSLLKSESRPLERALQGLDQGIRMLGPIPSLQYRAIDLERTHGQLPAALARLESLIRQSPRDPQLLRYYGDVLLESGRPDDARSAYRQGLAALESLPPSRRDSPTNRSLEHILRQCAAPKP